MKLQYLGDSKDCFKWDYHDFLTAELGYGLLEVALMLTPDDGGRDGRSRPSLFPARKEIVDFCLRLRAGRSVELLEQLPSLTRARYTVALHQGEKRFSDASRREYFADVASAAQQVLFLDPDNGFEPEKSRTDKHVAYADVERILRQTSAETVVSVFHHFRRVRFVDDFARIRERLERGHATAIYWKHLMFVTLSTCSETIRSVRRVNERYRSLRAGVSVV